MTNGDDVGGTAAVSTTAVRLLLINLVDCVVTGQLAGLTHRHLHPDLELHSNGRTSGRSEISARLTEARDAGVTYAVEYDEETWVEGLDCVAVRIWVVIDRPGDDPTDTEVVLLARFVEARIFKMWAVVWPDRRSSTALNLR